MPLDGTAQRPRPRRGLDPRLGQQPLLGRIGDLHPQVPLAEGRVDVLDEDVDDRPQVALAQGVEDDHLVDAIDELRAEGAPQLGQDLLFETLEARLLAASPKPMRPPRSTSLLPMFEVISTSVLRKSTWLP